MDCIWPMASALEIELEVIICALRRLSVIFGTIATGERELPAPFSGHIKHFLSAPLPHNAA